MICHWNLVEPAFATCMYWTLYVFGFTCIFGNSIWFFLDLQLFFFLVEKFRGAVIKSLILVPNLCLTISIFTNCSSLQVVIVPLPGSATARRRIAAKTPQYVSHHPRSTCWPTEWPFPPHIPLQLRRFLVVCLSCHFGFQYALTRYMVLGLQSKSTPAGTVCVTQPESL